MLSSLSSTIRTVLAICRTSGWRPAIVAAASPDRSCARQARLSPPRTLAPILCRPGRRLCCRRPNQLFKIAHACDRLVTDLTHMRTCSGSRQTWTLEDGGSHCRSRACVPGGGPRAAAALPDGNGARARSKCARRRGRPRCCGGARAPGRRRIAAARFRGKRDGCSRDASATPSPCCRQRRNDAQIMIGTRRACASASTSAAPRSPAWPWPATAPCWPSTACPRRATTMPPRSRAIAAMVRAARSSRRRARGSVGIGMPGSVSPASGLVQNANSTWLNGRPFAPRPRGPPGPPRASRQRCQLLCPVGGRRRRRQRRALRCSA